MRIKRIAAVLAALFIGVTGAVAISSPASAAPVAVGVYSADFQAQVVEIESMEHLNQTDKIVQVIHLSPFAMKSLGQCGQWVYCLWTSTSYGGDIYAWNTAWNNTCVPIGGSMNNNGESFANHMGPHTQISTSIWEGWNASLYSGTGCALGGFIAQENAQENDPSLSPFNNLATSFRTFWCNGVGC